MAEPKVVVIGAGSLFFGRQAIWQMVTSDTLNRGTLGLVDTDPTHLARMTRLARKAIEHRGSALKLESSTDRREVLKNADFVVLSFAYHSVKYRALDCELSARTGIRMCSGDTIGPGGIMRTLREFPHILACCRDIEELCPNAWVINYINPTAANGIGLRLFAPKLKSFALCDGLHMPRVKNNYARHAGLIGPDETLSPEQDAAFDLRIAGPNHFTWILKAEYEGEDVMPRIADHVRAEASRETDQADIGAKALFNNTIVDELYRAFGHISACPAHTKEYVRYWQGHGVTEDVIPPLSLWDHIPRYEWHWRHWNEIDGFNYGALPMEKFFDETGPDHATDIIETMWGGLNKPFYINTANGGCVPNMPDDAFLEVLCDLSMERVTPRAVGPAPVGLRGLWQQVLDTHELTARAAAGCDRQLLTAAFACDPLTQSLADTRRLIEELLAAERDALPGFWFTR